MKTPMLIENGVPEEDSASSIFVFLATLMFFAVLVGVLLGIGNVIWEHLPTIRHMNDKELLGFIHRIFGGI